MILQPLLFLNSNTLIIKMEEYTRYHTNLILSREHLRILFAGLLTAYLYTYSTLCSIQLWQHRL